MRCMYLHIKSVACSLKKDEAWPTSQQVYRVRSRDCGFRSWLFRDSRSNGE